jgi:hypothetical protein
VPEVLEHLLPISSVYTPSFEGEEFLFYGFARRVSVALLADDFCLDDDA